MFLLVCELRFFPANGSEEFSATPRKRARLTLTQIRTSETAAPLKRCFCTEIFWDYEISDRG